MIDESDRAELVRLRVERQQDIEERVRLRAQVAELERRLFDRTQDLDDAAARNAELERQDEARQAFAEDRERRIAELEAALEQIANADHRQFGWAAESETIARAAIAATKEGTP